MTKERWVTIRSQIKHFLYFVGDKKLSSIPPHKFHEYYGHRKSYSPKVRMLTLIHESSTIKNFYNFCIERNYLDYRIKPVFQKIRKSDVNVVRSELTIKEWRTIYRHLQGWGRNRPPKEKEQKKFIRFFILLLCNTGLRFGEGRQLKWEDLSVKGSYLRIDLKRGKTKNRVIVGRRPDLFQKIRKLSKHTHPNDFVFVDNDTGNQIIKDVYYKYWNEMLGKTGLDKVNKQIVYYCLRHTYSTFRLYSGVDVFTLSKNLGCSVKFIEEHYGHVNVEKMSKELTQDIGKEHYKVLVDD